MLKMVAAAVLLAAVNTSPDPHCAYYSAAGQTVRFSEAGDWLVFDAGTIGGGEVTCAFDGSVTLGWVLTDCGTWQTSWLVGSQEMGANRPDLLVFAADFFYWRCPSGI